ncbi:MAG: hypothetical protein AAGI72_24675 [Pseudomonadota bacterium]
MNDIVNLGGDTPAAPEPSFRERKAAQLAAEAGQADEPRPILDSGEDEQDSDLGNGAPDSQLESAGDTDPSGDAADDQDDLDDGSDLDDGAPEDDDPDLDQPTDNWEQRYKDLQRSYTEATEHRRAVEEEATQAIESATQLRHQVEDRLRTAERYAEVYSQGFDQQIQRLQDAFKSGQIEPDKIPAAQQQLYALQAQKQHVEGTLQEIQRQAEEVRELESKRAAEISSLKLRRLVPGWSEEKYREIGSFALTQGYSAEEFKSISDWRVIKLLNDSMQMQSANDTVQQVQRRKRGSPRRTARDQPRSADGRYRAAEKDFRANPNTRGKFAAVMEAKLAKERGGR